MRKLKTNKKDVEKKKKQVATLLTELLDTHMNKHDRPNTIRLTEEIMALSPTEPYPCEKVTSILVDINETDRAAKASEYMEKHFPPSSYRMFLKSRVYDLRHDYESCIKYAEKALEIPDATLLTKMMIHNILGHAYRYVGDAPKSIEHYYKSSVNDISPYKNEPETYKYLFNIKCDDYSNYLFSLHNVNISREDLFKAICDYNDIFKDFNPYQHDRLTHPRHEKIRIGYISPDIRRHVVAFFSYAFYKAYDKSRFEVYCYPKCMEDQAAQEFKKSVDHWTNILFDTPAQAAEKIKNDEIDILVDLSGHTANNTLQVMAYKPAPVQISAIGWFNSTGLKTIDYFLCDKYTDPQGLNDDFFSEKILRLQHSHFCYMWHDAPSEITPAPCTKNGYITFVSFNNFAKVTDETLRAWAKIINAVPNSKLFLKGKAFRTEYGINDAKERMKAAGLPLDRVIMEADEIKYLHKYNLTDIALDTFPYPGGGTTCDALYMGIPVITLVGERHNARFGYSLLHNMGLDELCTFSEEEYIQKAIDLANDWDRVRNYHLTLRRQMRQSPIMNDTIYMAEVESAYEKIFNAWINGEELPDFPQDEPPITTEDAEKFYQRALEYVNYEEGFNEGKIENIVNVKRAAYYLDRATEVENKNLAEIYLLLAKAKENLNDYAGAYEKICSAKKYFNDQTDRELIKRYDVLRGELAIINSNNADAFEHFNHSINLANDFEERTKLFSKTLDALENLNISTADLANTHFQYQKIFDNVKPYDQFNDFNGIIEGQRRIKVCYVSKYFCKSDKFAFIYGILACHNKNNFEVYCYSTSDADDPFTNAIVPAVEHFERVDDLTIEQLAEKIHDDQIDILVDLDGHSPTTSLAAFSYKPAPIQISAIGAAATTGLNTMNYFITDKQTDPPELHQKYFKETFIYFPCQFSYASNSEAPKPVYPPCLKNNYVTFGAFHSYKKISDDILKIWNEILKRVPDSKLIIRSDEFKSDSMVDSAYNRLKKIGFNMDNVTFKITEFDYLKHILDIDIMLDTFPRSDAAMTFDSIFMGVPVVSLYYERRDSRFALSIMQNINGLKDFAVNNVNEYIGRAVGLANDKDALTMLHKNLRSMMQKTDTFQPKIYIQILEQCYNQLIKKMSEVKKEDEDKIFV